jgi:uncharacterized protein (TIGR01777 family)
MKIVLTGASGLIGKKLTYALMRDGHEVFALARSPEKLPELPPKNIFVWNDQKVPSPEIFKNCDAVIHLAGEGIADKLWTKDRKAKLRESRVIGTKNLVEAVASLPADQRPHTFISGSAIGFYGDSSEQKDETSPAGQGFLAELCRDWEAAAAPCEKLGLRTVYLRTGLVLAREGGLLSKSGPAVLGDGTQWMSWIHIEDVVALILFALAHAQIRGPLNLTAKNPVTNKDFTKGFAKATRFPFTVSAPKFAIYLLAGDLSQAILSNQKIVPTLALAAGFKFKFDRLEDALNDLLGDRKLLDNSYSAKQFVPFPRSEVFSFFSRAENLEILTPPWLNFHILDQSTPTVKKETLINYKLNIHGVPVKWRTLIKEWNPDSSFVDFQLKGPYKLWHHRHKFEDVPGGTLISDDVTFQIPGWIFGKMLLPLIKKDVQEIFAYRQEKIKELCAEGRLK